MINIGGDPTDPFYRYRRDKISVEYQKKNTVLKNLDSVAKSLNRDPLAILTFVAKHLSTHISNKKSYVLAGAKTCDDIESALRQYTERHVLCTKCGNPETVPSGTIRHCGACGADS